MFRECLQKILGFNKWHLNNLQERYYAVPVIDRINDLIRSGRISKGMIVEIGCGLGDIIASIQWCNKVGYDTDKRIILAAKILHPLTVFRTGSFNNLRGKKISVLIALNFLHEINCRDCSRYFRKFLRYNKVDTIVVDTVQSPPYPYAHDYERMLSNLGYVVEYKSRGYVAWENTRRRVIYFRRSAQHNIDKD